jgi:hypothetical protein
MFPYFYLAYTFDILLYLSADGLSLIREGTE